MNIRNAAGSILLFKGWPDTYNKSQPRGHISPKEWLIDLDEEIIPIPDALRKYHYFNQLYELVTPLSISMSDFLKFLNLHIQGLKGKNNYLKSDTYKYFFHIRRIML